MYNKKLGIMLNNKKITTFIVLCLLVSATAYGQDVVIRKRDCSVCKQSKPVSAFSGDSQKCKACVKNAEERRQKEIARKQAERDRIAHEQAERESKKAYELGEEYYYGRNGKSKNYTEAAKNYRKAAEQGHADGQNNLGAMYLNGYGVTKDYAEAVKWYRKAAEQGHADGQNNLGFMYDYGYGVTKDISQAKYWYKKAAVKGHELAKDNLKTLNSY